MSDKSAWGIQEVIRYVETELERIDVVTRDIYNLILDLRERVSKLESKKK